jgi:hypothetical protein
MDQHSSITPLITPLIVRDTVVQMVIIPEWTQLRRTDNIEDYIEESYQEPVPDSFPLEIEPDTECSICQECSDLLSLGCRHIVCNSCIRKLSQKICPQCREPITMRLVRKRK